MKNILHFALVAALLVAIAATSPSFTGLANASNEFLLGLSFTVDSEIDAADANPGDGSCADASGACTLRAAIQETNAWEGADTITLPAGTYMLTIPDELFTGDEDAATTGDLDILDSLTILGAGQDSTTIQGGFDSDYPSFDRTFHVLNAKVEISGVTIQNIATSSDAFCVDGSGGGILNGGELTLLDSAVQNSCAIGNSDMIGKGDAIFNGGSMLLVNVTIGGNGTEGGGTATITNQGTASIINSQIIGNFSYYNTSGIENSGTLTLENSVIKGNGGRCEVAGLYNHGSVTIKRSKIDGNGCDDGSGGIVTTGGQMTIVESTISNNWGQDGCGGICTSVGSSLTVTNSTISGNSVWYGSGGLYLNSGAKLTNVTITGNSGIDSGGLYVLPGTVDPVTLQNSIIAGNHEDGFASDYPDCWAPEGGLVSLGHNLFGVLDGCVSVPVETDLYGVLDDPLDTLLGPLANNGGSTMTHALLPGSPAIDAIPSCNLKTDQIGTKRPQGLGCDIGAYELKQKVQPIDIKPGAFPNTINPSSTGTIPVAILATKTFNPQNRVEQSSLTFGRTGWEASLNLRSDLPDCISKDVNGDGRLDLLCRFKIQKMGFLCGDTVGVLRGKAKDSQFFVGQDSVVITCP